MKISKEVREGELLPAWYGVAWRRWDANTAICYPVPLNVLCAWCRGVLIWLKHGGRIVPSNSREAYAQGLRDGKRAR